MERRSWWGMWGGNFISSDERLTWNESSTGTVPLAQLKVNFLLGVQVHDPAYRAKSLLTISLQLSGERTVSEHQQQTLLCLWGIRVPYLIEFVALAWVHERRTDRAPRWSYHRYIIILYSTYHSFIFARRLFLWQPAIYPECSLTLSQKKNSQRFIKLNSSEFFSKSSGKSVVCLCHMTCQFFLPL